MSAEIPGDGITAAYITVATLVGGLVGGLLLLVFLNRAESALIALLASLPLFVLSMFSAIALPAALAGAPKRLVGTDLLWARPFRRVRAIDLTAATGIAATTSRWTPGIRFHPATWTWALVLLHPDGEPLDATRLLSIGASVDEVPLWDSTRTRALLVPMADSTGAHLTRQIAITVRNHGGDVIGPPDRTAFESGDQRFNSAKNRTVRPSPSSNDTSGT